uniref:Secreted protein n=1 Tax=Arundo donax TaxID=35708 RepID=A0A0A9BT61_ARUDO
MFAYLLFCFCKMTNILACFIKFNTPVIRWLRVVYSCACNGHSIKWLAGRISGLYNVRFGQTLVP